MIESIEAGLKLVIGGNHDLELDKEYWTTHLEEGKTLEEHEEELEEALETSNGSKAKQARIIFLHEGTHEFKLEDGAEIKVYASSHI